MNRKIMVRYNRYNNFEGFIFDYFLSYDRILKCDFEKRKLFEKESELEKKSYSIKDVSKLLQAMNKYMSELGGKNDGVMDYENELKYWETGIYDGDCLRTLALGNSYYWLCDKYLTGKKDLRALWRCFDGCEFVRKDDDYPAYLFLKLSDQK